VRRVAKRGVWGWRSVATLAALGAAAGLARTASAADGAPVPALTDAAAAEVTPPADEPALEEQPAGATPQVSPLVVTGYVDVGFAKAQGDGTSYPPAYTPPAPGGPVDYYVDPFAPAVNSRGDVASTLPPRGRP
jgi:hypothetical protein